MNLEDLIKSITPADAGIAERARAKWDAVAKPLGSLGLLEDAVTQICAMTGTLKPDIKNRCAAVFCADNGVVAEGVTQTGSDVTAIVAKNMCTGQTSVCKMARVARCSVLAVDMGMFKPVEDSRMVDLRIAPGTQNFAKTRAMTRGQAELGIMRGAELAMKLAGQGCGLFVTGEMGIGNTTTASAVASVLLGEAPERMTGPGAGLSQKGLARKVEVIKAAIAAHNPDPSDALDVLSALGGFDMAAMAGMCLGAAAQKRPCVIDGFISGVAALLAVRLCPECSDYILASHISAEPAGRLIVEALGKKAFIDAGMRLGEGTGAVCALPLLDMAIAVFDEMSTFEEVNITSYRPF